MRALLLAAVLLGSAFTAPTASALICMQHFTEPYAFAECMVQHGSPQYNPPDPPPVGAPPAQWAAYSNEVIEYHLYYVLCVAVDPPRVEPGEDCGPRAVARDIVLP